MTIMLKTIWIIAVSIVLLSGPGCAVDPAVGELKPDPAVVPANVEPGVVPAAVAPETVPATVAPQVVAVTAEDQQLARYRADFESFAKAKLREMNDKHILARSRMKITKGKNGLYRALYHQLDDKSMSFQVNRSKSDKAQCVAVLSYEEQVYAASCATPEECRQCTFTPVEVIPNRHIFVNRNGVWQ